MNEEDNFIKYRISNRSKKKNDLLAILSKVPRGTTLDDVRMAYIGLVYESCDCNKTHTSAWLGISIRTIRNYINRGM